MKLILNRYSICATALFSVLNASAQTAGGYDVANVYDYYRPNYSTEGMNISAFNVKPTLGVQIMNNDNIFATNSLEIADYIVIYKPNISANTNWSKHDLSISAEGIFGEYASNNSESYQDYNLGLDGRFDISREAYITGLVDFNKKHEDRGSANDLNGVKPSEYSEQLLAVGFVKGLNKLNLSITADITKLDFDDVFTSAGTELDNDIRDRKEYEISAQLGYEIIPEYEAFIRTSYRNREYDVIGAVNRDSNGYEVVVGTDIDITSKVKGEAFAGYLHQGYDSTSLSDINSPSFGGSVIWKPTGLTSLDFAVQQSVQETSTDINTSGYVSTISTLRAEHELRRNLLFAAGFGYSNNAYEGAAIGQNERNDNIANVSLNSKYLLNKRIAVGAEYKYENRDSNITGQDYKRNIFMLNLSGSLY